MSRIYLVSCVGQKLDHPAPAEDLYVSDWFKKARAYVEWAINYYAGQMSLGEIAYDTDAADVTWVSGPTEPDDLSYLFAARAPGDPKRTPRHLRVDRDFTAKWRRDLLKTPSSVFRKAIYEHLRDGEPRTLNRIGVELIDKSGNGTYNTPFGHALLELVSEYLVEFTYVDWSGQPELAGPGRKNYLLFRDMQPKHEDQWFILSAEYGLLEPDEVVEPYDRTLKSMSKAERKEWSEEVLEQLFMYLAPGDDVWFFAGKHYREFLMRGLHNEGMSFYAPLEGMGIGQQKQWLKSKVS